MAQPYSPGGTFSMMPRDWEQFRERRQAVNMLRSNRLGGEGYLTESNLLWTNSRTIPNVSLPLFDQGLQYTLKEGGIRADAEWEQIATNTMDDGTKSTPAIADGRIYLRTYSALYCFEKAD